MNKKLVKELFIVALLAIVVIFILGILFYDYIPVEQKITSVKYVPDENVTATINEIKLNSGEDITDDKQDSFLQSYTIDKDELSNYDDSYESGKVDPFAEDSDPVDEKTTTKKTNVVTNTYQSGKVENVKNNTTNTSKTNTAKNDKTNTTKQNTVNQNTAVKNNKTNTTNTTNTTKTNTVSSTNTVKDVVKNTVKNETTTGKFFENQYSK